MHEFELAVVHMCECISVADSLAEWFLAGVLWEQSFLGAPGSKMLNDEEVEQPWGQSNPWWYLCVHSARETWMGWPLARGKCSYLKIVYCPTDRI